MSLIHALVLCFQSDWTVWFSFIVNGISVVYLPLRCLALTSDDQSSDGAWLDLNNDGVVDDDEQEAFAASTSGSMDMTKLIETTKRWYDPFCRFWFDPRGDRFSMQNRVVCATTTVGMAGMVIYSLSHESVRDYPELLQAAEFMMAFPLLRVFVDYPPFLNIAEKIRHGLEAVFPIFIVLSLIYYIFCIAAYHLFKENHVHNDLGFTSLPNTFLTMYQIFIGAELTNAPMHLQA